MRGFTLIELLLVIGIFLAVGVAVTPLYGNLSVATQLNEETSQLTANVRIAREQSLAGLGDSAHGVCFESLAGDPDRYILYSGATCASRAPAADRIVTLPPVLTLSVTFPGQDLNFSRTGAPSATGTITLIHAAGGERRITINELGLVEEN